MTTPTVLQSPRHSPTPGTKLPGIGASSPGKTNAVDNAHPGPAFDTVPLSWQIEQAVANSDSLGELLAHLARVIHDQTDCLALWFSMPGESGQFESFRAIPARDDDAVWPVVEDLARSIVPAATESGQLCHRQFQPLNQLVIAPVRTNLDASASCHAVWVACFSTKDQTPVRQHWLLSLVTQATAAWFAKQSLAGVSAKSKQLSDVLATVAAMSRTDRVSQTAMVLCNHLRKHLSVEQVALSLTAGRGAYKLTSVSDVETVDLASESSKLLAEACSAAARANQLVRFPDAEPDSSAEQKSLQQYCQAQHAEACVSLPLRNTDGVIIATALLTTTAERIGNPAIVDHYSKMVDMLGVHLDTVVRANRTGGQLLTNQLRRLKSARWARNAAILAAVAGLLMCLPLPYRIACDCTIQPVKRRYVAAPYDGILDRSLVKLGDVVTADQIVARMDEGNLRIELSGVEAELGAARKKRDSALAQGEVAQSQIARSEMRRHQAQIELLTKKLTNLEIRTPIAGLVIAGDLEKAEGAPLEMGQTVFEVAPLDRMVAEIAIEEAEIPYARPGMEVTLKLNAFPFRTWPGTVQRISPSTEIVNDKSAFIAEVEIENTEMQLKPGMAGSAKIVADRAPLGWSLFHRPYESLRYWMVW